MLKIENHLDLDSLLARTDGDMNLVAEVFDIFWENLPDQLSTLREAIDRNDAREVMTSAHSLKGSLGNLSAHAAHDAALALENAGRQGKLDLAGQHLDALKNELDDLKIVLDELLADNDPTRDTSA